MNQLKFSSLVSQLFLLSVVLVACQNHSNSVSSSVGQPTSSANVSQNNKRVFWKGLLKDSANKVLADTTINYTFEPDSSITPRKFEKGTIKTNSNGEFELGIHPDLCPQNCLTQNAYLLIQVEGFVPNTIQQINLTENVLNVALEPLLEAEIKGKALNVEDYVLNMVSDSAWFTEFKSDANRMFIKKVTSAESLEKLQRVLDKASQEVLPKDYNNQLKKRIESGGQLLIFFAPGDSLLKPESLFDFDQKYTFISRNSSFYASSPVSGSTLAPSMLHLYLLPDKSKSIYFYTNFRGNTPSEVVEF